MSLTQRLQLDERQIIRIETANKNKGKVILPADKGRVTVTVVMDKKDDTNKMDSLANDRYTNHTSVTQNTSRSAGQRRE